MRPTCRLACCPSPALACRWRPADLRLDSIRLPPGFAIEVYADGYIPARFLALGKVEGNTTVVYASTAEENAVFAIVDKHDGRPRQACVLLHNLSSITQPNGIAYDRSTGSLYIAGVSSGASAGCMNVTSYQAVALGQERRAPAHRRFQPPPALRLHQTLSP